MSEQTRTYHKETIDSIIAKLLDMLGFNKDVNPEVMEEINKLFSQVTEEERESLMWYIDLYNTYHWDFCKIYVFEFLKLGVSLGRKGREEIKEIGKTPLQQETTDKTRMQKFVDLFR